MCQDRIDSLENVQNDKFSGNRSLITTFIYFCLNHSDHAIETTSTYIQIHMKGSNKKTKLNLKD